MNLGYAILTLLCLLASVFQLAVLRTFKAKNADVIQAAVRLKAGSWLILSFACYSVVFTSRASHMPVYIWIALGFLAFGEILRSIGLLNDLDAWKHRKSAHFPTSPTE